MDGDEARVRVYGSLALALALVGWVSFLAYFLGGADPGFLLLAIAAGGTGFGLSLWLRLHAHAAASGGVAAAAGLSAYGLLIASFLTATLVATGLLVAFVLLIFLVALFMGSWWVAMGPRGGSGCEPCPPCCEPCSCCCEPCSCCDPGGCCSCGDCCGGCGDCGCGSCDCGCGGCACAGLAVATMTRAPLAPLLERLAHHPDLPEYEADVYRVRGARLCVGCFTTYPVFLLAATALALLPSLPWTHLLAWGAVAASAQGISSAGLARTRLRKALVKTSLGAGLAMVTWGVHGAPWPPAWKLAALLATLALAYASALPRARRMRARRASG